MTTTTTSVATTPGSAQDFRTEYEFGPSGGFSFGYGFKNGLRPEIGLSYRSNDIKLISSNNTILQGGTGRATSISAMANLWFDLNNSSRFTPYFGMGLGASHAGVDSLSFDRGTTVPGTANDPGTTANEADPAIFRTSDTDLVMAYQAGAGVGFTLNPRLQLSLDYRFLITENPSLDNPQNPNRNIDTEYENQSAFLTLRYTTGGSLLADSDGDGVHDGSDRCAGTPAGVSVDRYGCARDSDGDGVADHLDKCPATPAGAPVGSRGCPLDSDRDGVADYQDKCPGTPAKTPVNRDGCPQDSDGDGVSDLQDKCPGTAKGLKVSETGCPLDSDGDGIADHLDKCPSTPAGVKVGPHGCPLDSDRDGVADYLDKCPGTPAGTKVGVDGCVLDSDGDGVVDASDRCPETPVGVKVDPNGCPFDGDGDGIPDYADQCQDTPAGQKVGPNGCALDSDGDGIPDEMDECPRSPAGAKVLANGCALKNDCRTPRAGEQVDANGCAVDKSFILKGVNFEFDSDRLTPEAKLILNQVGDTLAAYPDVKVEIAGHTDSLGTDAYNLGLSERRSISVENYLMGRNIDTGRMTPTGYGKSQPIDPAATDEAYAINRRVELRVQEEEAAR